MFSEGDRCINSVTRVSGTCENVRNCPHAVKEFQSGVRPQICSYAGSEPIICCARQSPASTQIPAAAQQQQPFSPVPTQPFPSQTQQQFSPQTQHHFSPTQQVPQPTQQIPVQQNPTVSGYRKSQERCIEYSKLAIERNVVGSFSLAEQTSNTVETSKCTASTSDGFIVGGK